MPTTNPPIIPGLRPDPPRVKSGPREGWYILPDPRLGGDRQWQRATTLAHIPTDETLLSLWRERMVAEGIALGPDDLFVRITALADVINGGGTPDMSAKDAKTALNALCEEAKIRAGAGDGAAWGTALHSLTEWHDAGRINEIETPIELLADLAAYVTGMDERKFVRPREFIERIIVNEELDTAGTFDRLIRMPQASDELIVFDLKTQKTLGFGYLEIAIQLAEYAHAEFIWDIENGTYIPMPKVNREFALVGHLPVGSAQLTIHEVDLVEGWSAALEARAIRDRRATSKRMGRVWTPRPEPTREELLARWPSNDERAASRYADHPNPLVRKIGMCGNEPALTALWRANRASWDDEATSFAKLRKAELA